MRIKSLASALIFGFIFSACGCLFSFIFGQEATLHCTRVETSQIQCDKQSRWLGWLSLGRESFQGLRGAQVAQNCDDDGCTYRVELDTAGGQTPMTGYYSSGLKSKQETANRINAFLQNPQEDSLTVKSGAGLLGLLVPLVFILVGPLIAFSGFIRALRGF